MSDTKQPERGYSLDAAFSINKLAGNGEAIRLTVGPKAPGAFGSSWVAALWRKSSAISASGPEREREDTVESAEGETAEKAFATLIYKLRERAANDARKKREEAEWKQAELDTWDRQEWRGEEAKR